MKRTENSSLRCEWFIEWNTSYIQCGRQCTEHQFRPFAVRSIAVCQLWLRFFCCCFSSCAAVYLNFSIDVCCVCKGVRAHAHMKQAKKSWNHTWNSNADGAAIRLYSLGNHSFESTALAQALHIHTDLRSTFKHMLSWDQFNSPCAKQRESMQCALKRGEQYQVI